jgi:hypothetical protein
MRRFHFGRKFYFALMLICVWCFAASGDWQWFLLALLWGDNWKDEYDA